MGVEFFIGRSVQKYGRHKYPSRATWLPLKQDYLENKNNSSNELENDYDSQLPLHFCRDSG